MKTWLIIAVIYTTYAVVKFKCLEKLRHLIHVVMIKCYIFFFKIGH